jgi:SAM-dependent methyltransferase
MSEQLLDSVKSKYGAVAESTLSSDHAGVKAVAEAFGYTAEELTSIPAEANMGLSCGNPTATAHLKPGEVVVDLGSGGGLDVFLASKMVGPEGRAIGIDMTTAMIERSRESAQKGGYTNVEFYQSTIDQIPLPDASVDCVISNCVVNPCPRQAGRVPRDRPSAQTGRPRCDGGNFCRYGTGPGCASRAVGGYAGDWNRSERGQAEEANGRAGTWSSTPHYDGLRR